MKQDFSLTHATKHATKHATIYFTFMLIAFASGKVFAQNSAPSSHFVFDDQFDGDIIVNQVRVPKAGDTLYTYYEALGWRGKGAGYAGIQSHPRGKNFIFSIWDHKEHAEPIRAAYHGPGTKTEGFGGEGTGLKSWNFELGWSTDVWYTLVARTWPVGDHTYYGFWVQSGQTKKWTHMVTMDVAVPAARFRGGTDAFIEDWLSTGAKPRTTHLRNGWKRKMNGDWFPFGSGRYSVNYWDLEKGKRSYDFRTNWDGGIKKDNAGEFYFMTSGGKATSPSTKNLSRHSIARTGTSGTQKPSPEFDKLKVESVTGKKLGDQTIQVKWKLNDETSPQFSYQIQIYDNEKLVGEPVVVSAMTSPESRSAVIKMVKNKEGKLSFEGDHWGRLICTDIFQRSVASAGFEISK